MDPLRKLLKDVKEKTMKSYQARRDDNGKLLKNAANFGLKKNGIITRARKNSEYHGVTVQILEPLKPLLIQHRIIKTVKMLIKNNIKDAINYLQITEEVKDEGINILYYILSIWLQKNKITVPQEFKNKAQKSKNKLLNKWILHKRSEPILVPIKVLTVGKSNVGVNVLPESWINKVFDSGYHLHREMDKLDWRKGRPAVHYCCVHSMTIKDIYQWSKTPSKNFQPQIGIEIIPDQNLKKLNSKYLIFKNKTVYNIWLQKLPSNINLLPGITYNYEKIIIAADLNLLTQPSNYKKTENVGLLVSRLQKCIRRGRHCPKLLYETVTNLWQAPPYNLPDQQFARVSASRQLVWRLYITIMEDVEPYLETPNCLSLIDLITLTLISQQDPSLTFSKKIYDKILLTALRVQYNDELEHNWDWRSGKTDKINLSPYRINFNKKGILNSIKLSLRTLPMMNGDNRLLTKSYNLYLNSKKKYTGLNNKTIQELLLNSKPQIELQAKYASNDMHCFPNIILQIQSYLPFIPYSVKQHGTKAISNFIWDYSSRINTRRDIKLYLNSEKKQMLKTLKLVQRPITQKLELSSFVKPNTSSTLIPNSKISKLKARIGFLKLFGKKLTLNRIDIIVAGTKLQPCKIKRSNKNKNSEYLSNKERYISELKYIDYMKKKRQIKLPDPPIGYQWNIKPKKIHYIWAKLIKTDKTNFTNIIKFYIDNIELDPFDASSILTRNPTPKTIKFEKPLDKLFEQALYIKIDNHPINLTMRDLGNLRYQHSDFQIYNWLPIAIKSQLSHNFWKSLLVKFYNDHNGTVQIGPVNRQGNKLHESINYLYEGTILRMFNMLYALYPLVVSPSGQLKFRINRTLFEYDHLISTIKTLAFQTKKIDKKIIIPQIKTKLWDHQKRTRENMVHNLLILKKQGYGDASEVGSGKTLTAISIMKDLLEYNIKNKIYQYYGFVVLVPTKSLITTWIDEINKHTKNFDKILQAANGKLNNTIKPNSILITTLARMRSHPINHSWQIVVVDECLSVQNRDALQTQEAFRQILCSQFGVIMMSATFFRSRFDKLFYMLKMLRSELPENKDYLDTILSEYIVCHKPKNTRNWITNINKVQLSKNYRREYNKILSYDLNAEKLYQMLSKYIYDHHDYIKSFKQILKKLDDKKVLIYCRSKEEADNLTSNNIGRYPDISKQHVCVSYNEGTYGLNNLVNYNCILTRPHYPDFLPQQKGRLDRPGQKNSTLYLEYILLKDTIEEAWLLRLQMANSFHKNYIMPLSEFYDYAINK